MSKLLNILFCLNFFTIVFTQGIIPDLSDDDRGIEDTLANPDEFLIPAFTEEEDSGFTEGILVDINEVVLFDLGSDEFFKEEYEPCAIGNFIGDNAVPGEIIFSEENGEEVGRLTDGFLVNQGDFLVPEAEEDTTIKIVVVEEEEESFEDCESEEGVVEETVVGDRRFLA